MIHLGSLHNKVAIPPGTPHQCSTCFIVINTREPTSSNPFTSLFSPGIMRAEGNGVQHAVIEGKRAMEEQRLLSVHLGGVMEEGKGKSKDVRYWVNSDDRE